MPPATTPKLPPISAPAFPSVTRNARIYAPQNDPYFPFAAYHGGAIGSRYVLYADSSFGLQFSSGRYGFFEYGGRYTRVDSRIVFSWDGWSTMGPWGAEGTLRGDTLTVAYNLVMAMADFIGGTYLFSTATP